MAPAPNPPTLIDVINAHDYAVRNATKHGPGGLPAPTALVGGPGAMPAWFKAWDANEFQPLKETVDAIRIDLATFRAQFANERCATGHQFEVVLFVSGDDPTGELHNLPAIQNTTDIVSLTPAALTSYLTGYGLSAQGNPAVRTRRLARHIGRFGLP